MKAQIEMMYAVEDAIKNQESVLIEASTNNAEKIFKNAKARIRVAKAFSQLNETTIELIATHAISNKIDLEELCDYSNYKKANRIAQRACYMTDSSLDSRTIQNLKIFDKAINSLNSMFNSFSFESIASKTSITESMLKNIVDSAQFFNLIERVDNLGIKAIIKSDTLYRVTSK